MLMRGILIPFLAAGTVMMGVAHADAAEFIFRYRGKGPTQVAAVTPPEPTAARIVTAPFVWNRGPAGVKDGPAQAGDALRMNLVFPDPASPYPDKIRFKTIYVRVVNPNAVSLGDIVAEISASVPEVTASEEDGRLVLTTRAKGPDARVGFEFQAGFQEVGGYLDPSDYPEFPWFERSASTGLASIPMTCGTDG
jgi:hypothetical protein